MHLLSKLVRVKSAFRRHSDVETVIQSADFVAITDMQNKLERRTTAINKQTVITKTRIEQLISQQLETREKLRSLKLVQTKESSGLRDRLLIETHSIMLEDIRDAWLRKEQLQIMELLSTLRRASSPAGSKKSSPRR